jgi:surface antigen
MAATQRAVVPRVPAKPKKQNPFVALLVLLVVPGFILTASLPAYAFLPGGSPADGKLADAGEPLQQVKVDTQIQAAAVQRDVIGATSEAELQAQRISNALFASYAAGPRQAGDDYPWPTAASVLSPLSYYYRQCVDFVAWRLNRDVGVTSAPWKYVWSNLTPTGGNASQWKYAWQQHHWKISATPIVGSVAWFPANHVAYVKAIEGNNVVIEEYNAMVSLGYSMRTIPKANVGAFLYPPSYK